MNKLNLIREITGCNIDYITGIIPRELISKHSEINWGNNGIGDRFCNKLFNYVSINKNKTYKENYINLSHDQINELISEIDEYCIINLEQNKKLKGIIGIKLYGLRTENSYRPIKASIKKNITQNAKCVVCGCSSNLCCDHKNDMYNDTRVLSIDTQTISDFQPLCNHCNLQKRQVNKHTKKDKQLYYATQIPMLTIFGIDFIDLIYKPYDENDINLLTNTFWYDPVKFMKHIYDTFMNKIKELIYKYESSQKENKQLIKENKQLIKENKQLIKENKQLIISCNK